MAEIVVAILILGLGLGGTMGLTASLLRMNDFSSQMTSAVTVGHDKLEALLQEDYDSLSSGNDTVSGYTLDWVVSGGPATDTKTIDIDIDWQDADGNGHSTSLTTLVAKGF